MRDSLHYTAGHALAQLHTSVARAFDDDATGGVYSYRRVDGEPTLARVREDDDLEALLASDGLEMIIVDSGNSDGDAWKYVYHVSEQAGLHVVETELPDHGVVAE